MDSTERTESSAEAVLPRLLREFGQHFGCVRIAGGCQAPEFFEIFLLGCEFNELILSVFAASVRKAPQLVEVFPLRGKLDEFTYGVVVSSSSPLPERREIRV